MSNQQLTLTEALDMFIKRAHELQKTRLLQSKPSLNWSMQIDEHGNTSFDVEEPDEEDQRSCLLTFRQFVSDNEPIHVNRIFNLLHLHATDEELKERFAATRAALKFAEHGSGIGMVHNGTHVSATYLADLWINGTYFHNDVAKQRALDELMPFPAVMVKNRFLVYVLQASHVIIRLASMILDARERGLIDERTGTASP
jgi:hypothetical protein